MRKRGIQRVTAAWVPNQTSIQWMKRRWGALVPFLFRILCRPRAVWEFQLFEYVDCSQSSAKTCSLCLRVNSRLRVQYDTRYIPCLQYPLGTWLTSCSHHSGTQQDMLTRHRFLHKAFGCRRRDVGRFLWVGCGLAEQGDAYIKTMCLATVLLLWASLHPSSRGSPLVRADPSCCPHPRKLHLGVAIPRSYASTAAVGYLPWKTTRPRFQRAEFL